MTRTVPLGLHGRITLDTEKGLDAYAWPGGYPIVYYTDDGTMLCADCATKQEKENSEPDALVTHGYRIDGADVLEGGAVDHGIVTCEECGKEIVGLDIDWEWKCECGQVNDNDDGNCQLCGKVKE